VHFTSERRNGDLIERQFVLGEIPGMLWTPARAASPVHLILLGHPGGLNRMLPRLAARAEPAAAQGFASVAIELPGAGDRPASASAADARAAPQRAIAAGERPSEEVIDRLILPLVEQAVPEWRVTMDALLELPGIGGPVGISGGVIAIGARLALVEPRIAAAVLFAGSYVPRSIIEEARRVTIPLHVLLQWDDEGNDRQLALEVFDAFGSPEKQLIANMGGHTGVPHHAGENASGFFARHLVGAR